MLAWTKRIDLFVKGARIERHTTHEHCGTSLMYRLLVTK